MSEQQIDQILISQVLAGDNEAFDILVLKYQAPIKGVIFKMIHDPSLVSDIAQETFIRAYSSLPGFKGKSSFYTWLYRIAINTAKNYLRYKNNQPIAHSHQIPEVDYKEQLKLTDIEEPYQILKCDEMRKTVLDAVNRLPDELRTSLILREMGGLSYEEIANIMQCPLGTVRSRIFRARLSVDDEIQNYLSTGQALKP